MASIISTAVAEVADPAGKFHPIRIELDTAAEGSFISERIIQLLGLERLPHVTLLSGIADTDCGLTTGMVFITLGSRKNNKWTKEIMCHILPKVANDTASQLHDP